MITRPCASASGPPEFPGASRTSAVTQRCRPGSECTTPVVSAPMNPNGLPMAITSSPIRRAPRCPESRQAAL